MTTLYRSPNIKIDGIQWHVAVLHDRGLRPRVVYRFRKDWREMWQDKAKWPGKAPTAFNYYFRPFIGHVRLAVDSVGDEPCKKRKVA